MYINLYIYRYLYNYNTMKIKELNNKDLKLFCLDILTKSFVELGQVKDDKTLAILAQTLSNDLLEDFNTLTTEDVKQSFRNGIRHTEIFVLNVQTYYKWLNSHKKIIQEDIWNKNNKIDYKVDKRLKYRSRTGTGLTNINKLIK